MGAVLTIESDEAVRLAERLAEVTGQPMQDAVITALSEKLEAERKRHEAMALSEELLAIGRACAALLEPPFHSSDHAELYGDDGLPA